MKLNINLKNLAKITNGKIIKGKPDTIIDSFCFNTKKIKKREIFFALKGKNIDANDLIENAIEKGACGIICNKRKFPKKYLNKVSFCLEVNDTLKSLHNIAAFHRSKFEIPIISITGSNGKTTTKEMVKKVMMSLGDTCSNIGNFNNEFGLPFSILELNNSHKSGVFEIGASKRGEVAELSKILKPETAIITTIGPEHLEFFKSMENIYKTETEVIQYLKNENSIVIFNGDNEYLKRLKNLKIEKYSFGYNNDNDLIIRENQGKFCFYFNGKKTEIKLKIAGKHNYLNAAAAFLSGKIYNIETNDIIKSLNNFSGVRMRMQTIKIGGNIILFDAYNANPQSMEAALNEIKNYKNYILILGDMKELGKYSIYYHKELAKMILNIAPVKVFLIGKEIRTTFDYLKNKVENVKYYSSLYTAKKEVNEEINGNCGMAFLFKASRSMKFEELLPNYEKVN